MEGDTCPAVPPIVLATASPKPPVSPTNLLEEKVNVSPKPERASPEPNCAICLGKSENKSFTDSCLHQFCFSCLLEWSKVKAECPLCKQSFKSIIHNVRSNEDYDQYHLRPASDAVPYLSVDPDMRRFRYRSTLTAERRRDRTLANLVPFIFGTDSIPAQRIAHPYHRRRHLTSEFRNTVYQHNMWVNPLPDITGRYRECSPEFYRLNPAQMHRLVPWLNRELIVLLVNHPTHLVHVMDLILNLLTNYPIGSAEFRAQVFPHLGVHTTQFLHEFLAFARSPYDMIGFDQSAEYMYHPANFSVEIQSSSDSDSDVVVLSPEPSTSQTAPLPSTTNNEVFRRQLQSYPENLTVAHSRAVSPTAGTSGAGNIMLMLSERFRNGRLHSGMYSDVDSSSSSTTVDVTSEVHQAEAVASDPDECTIVGYVKPRHERTPEIITLDSEPEVVEEGEITIDDVSGNNFTSNDMSDFIFSSSSASDSSSDSDYLPSSIKKQNVKRRISTSKHSRNGSVAKLPPKKRHKCLFSSSNSSDCEHKRERSRKSKKPCKRVISDNSSSEDDRSVSQKCIAKSPKRPPRETWRIMKHQQANGYREPVADHGYSVECSTSNNYNPPYTTSEIATFTDKARPKLRSIVITRSATSDILREHSYSPVASSSRSSPHRQEGSSSRSSSHKRKHKSGKRDEKRRKKVKRRSSSVSPSPSHGPKSKRKKKKRTRKIDSSTESSS